LWSASTSAIIAATTGVPRMPTHGRAAPCSERGRLALARDRVLRDQDRAGRLERHPHHHRLPVEIPPAIPPAWLAVNSGAPSAPGFIGSAFCSPRSAAAWNPRRSRLP
jgi:hypothetical protein